MEYCCAGHLCKGACQLGRTGWGEVSAQLTSQLITGPCTINPAALMFIAAAAAAQLAAGSAGARV